MKNIFQIFKSPYPLADSPLRQLWRALIFGGFVFMFLIIFQPFGLNNAPTGIFKITFHFGLITTMVMLILNVVIPTAFKDLFIEQHWTVGKEIFWTMLNLLIIALANWIYSGQMGFIDLNFSGLLVFGLYTVAIGIFPITGFIIWKAYRMQKSYSTSSLAISERIEKNAIHNKESKHPSVTSEQEVLESFKPNGTISLHGEGETEVLEVERDHLFYLKSSGNYVEIYFENEEPRRRVVRATLKGMTKELKEFPEFFRCHKQYIVNLNKVERVSGNAQGLTLHLKGKHAIVPVSRSLTTVIRERFADVE